MIDEENAGESSLGTINGSLKIFHMDQNNLAKNKKNIEL